MAKHADKATITKRTLRRGAQRLRRHTATSGAADTGARISGGDLGFWRRRCLGVEANHVFAAQQHEAEQTLLFALLGRCRRSAREIKKNIEKEK